MRSETKPSSRIIAVDLVRLAAMAVMIQDHTLDALLQPAYQSASWYNLWVFCRGFTAPTFMLLSGFSFALATVRHWEQHLALTSTVMRRVRRFGFFVLLGYAMHFPVHSFRELTTMDVTGWRTWLQVDVLQTIGISLILLQALVFLTKTPRRFAKVAMASAAAIVIASPLVWLSGVSAHLGLGFGGYVDGATGSAFPLLPWSAYLLLGAGLGTYYSYIPRESPLPFARILFASGLGAMVAGIALHGPVSTLYGNLSDLFWHTSPTLFFTRAGFVLVALGVTLHVRRVTLVSPQTTQALAQESLLVYFVHVCLLYGSIWNPGLRQYFGGHFGLGGAVFTAVILIALMTAVALFWNRYKRDPRMPVWAVRACVGVAAAWALV